MAVVGAQDVAAELRRMLPGIPVKKLHKLLYYCQGHHLAQVGEPLFRESVMAWDMGPVVAKLWKAEKEAEAPGDGGPLDNGQLNTVAYVVSRYGGLTGADLERLTHAEEPWQRANQSRRQGDSVRIEPLWLKEFFSSQVEAGEDESYPSREAVSAITTGADARRQQPAVADDIDELRARLVGH